MTLKEPKKDSLSKYSPDIAVLISDCKSMFHLWVASLILLLMALIFNQLLNEMKYVITASILFIYLWLMLHAKLDQLASSISANPKNLAFKTLLIPVIGTWRSYHSIMHLASIHMSNHEAENKS